ncbi:MAG: RagB/SusD family nutrient uptake outer membrane protein [Bacteroidaceae bacterium]|nr:RagB/SusD family nutrient uptake outer membrane protein [Bacteroidaceae bacterium]
MKKIIFVLTICLGLLSSSCNDWLDLLPNNEQVTDNYWKSKEDVEAVVAAGYYNMRLLVPQMLRWGELRGGSLYTLQSKNDFLEDASDYQLQNFNLQPSGNVCRYWPVYKIIGMANSVLHYASSVRGLDDTYSEGALKAHLTEAYFMRAYCYFLLVRNYREVPLVLEAYVNDDAEYNFPKASESEIIAQIKEDLTTAIESGAAKTVYEEEWQTKGRVTLWALYALMADVCLWNEDYEEAIIYCNEILDASGAFRPVFIQDPAKFVEIYYPGNSNEAIFELNYDNALYSESNAMEWKIAKPKEEKILTGGFSFNSFVTASAPGTAASPLFLTPRAVEKVKEEVALVLANQTTVPERVGRTLMSGVMYGNMAHPYTDYEKQEYYYIWKYATNEYPMVTSYRPATDANFILYRVAEIILIKAEALIMSGTIGSTEWETAIGLMNQIRERAMLPALELAADQTDELSLLQALLNEREMEFLGEGKRWYDLLRFARKSNYSKYREEFVDMVLEGNTTNKSEWIQSVLQSNDALYMPIPQSEIDVNPLLIQNPYYSN